MLIDFIHAMRQGNKTMRWLTVKVREFGSLPEARLVRGPLQVVRGPVVRGPLYQVHISKHFSFHYHMIQSYSRLLR